MVGSMRVFSTVLVASAVIAAFIAGRSIGPQHVPVASAQAGAVFSHFKCYQTEIGLTQPKNVILQDQFGTQQTPVGVGDMFCTPVKKTLVHAQPEPVPGPADHLLCYRIQPKQMSLPRTIYNQLQKGV